MEIFISWSGERGKLIANALKQWLRDVLQATRPWTSLDMQKGVRLPEWLNRNLAVYAFAANGYNPLNFVSHARGSLQTAPFPLQPVPPRRP